MSAVRVRFAPSPTGELHLGGARTALINALFARAAGGSFVLRIEDTDVERNVDGAEARLEADLRWLDIHPDEGPVCGGPKGPYRQSERLDSHLGAFERIRASGRVYECFCSGGARVDRGCPGACRDMTKEERARRLASGEKPAFRFHLVDDDRTVEDLLRGRVTFAGAPAPDPVILRADGRPTFLFAGAVDDALQDITHVIRGEDHLPNAWKQVQLLGALGAPPPRYAHLPLILGDDRTPLSKRHGRTSVGALRDAGYLPEAVVLALAHLGMTAPEVAPGADPWPALVEGFSLEKLNRAAAVLDQGRLEFLSGAWMRALPADELARRSAEFSPDHALVADESRAQSWWPELLALAASSQTTLRDALVLAEALLSWRGAAREPAPVLEFWREHWPADGLPSAERFGSLSKEVSDRAGVKGAALFHPLRLALTGAETGPALSRLAPLLDRAAANGGTRFEVASCATRIARAIAGE